MKPSTVSLYEAETRRFLDRFECFFGAPPDPLDFHRLNKYLSFLYPDVIRTQATFRLHKHVIRRWVKSNTGKTFVEAFRIEEDDERYECLCDIKRLEAIFHANHGKVWGVVIHLSFLTGLRIMELLHLKVADVDFDRMLFQIPTIQEKGGRTVPFPESMKYLLLREAEHKNREDPLFSVAYKAKVYKAVSIRTIQANWSKITATHGLGKLSLAGLRRMNILLRILQEEPEEKIVREVGIANRKNLVKYQKAIKPCCRDTFQSDCSGLPTNYR